MRTKDMVWEELIDLEDELAMKLDEWSETMQEIGEIEFEARRAQERLEELQKYKETNELTGGYINLGRSIKLAHEAIHELVEKAKKLAFEIRKLEDKQSDLYRELKELDRIEAQYDAQ